MEEKAFRDWLSSYTDPEAALSAFASQKTFFRVNTLKLTVGEFEGKSRLRRTKTPYYDAAFALDENLQIGKTWEYFLGLIHPQALPSILVSLVLGPKPGETVLDVASAPGSKLSHMAMLMENRGVLVGNDLKGEKVSALFSTINRLNVLNCIVTTLDGSRLPWKEKFDKVLLDAPCTALGSGAAAFSRWDETHSKSIAELQKRMIASAYDALRPGGAMVYSTCTYAREENEDVVGALLESRQDSRLETVDLAFPREQGLGEAFKSCCRVYPQHLQSEGFFIAKISKVVG